MKHLIALLLVVLTLQATAQIKNDLERQKLKGEIKTVTEKEYNATEDSLMWVSVSSFNDTGMQVSFFTYSPDNKLLSKSVFTYNDTTGKLVDVKRYKADGALNVKSTFKYDMKGNKLEEANYDPQNVLFMTAKSRYDMKGDQMVKDCFDEFGILYLKTNYKYDKKGHDIEEKEYDSHHALKFSTTFEYENTDRNGNWRKRIMYKNDNRYAVTIREFEYR